MSKGDTPRPQNKEKYDAEFERVFGERPLKLWEDAPKYEEDGEVVDTTEGEES